MGGCKWFGKQDGGECAGRRGGDKCPRDEAEARCDSSNAASQYTHYTLQIGSGVNCE